MKANKKQRLKQKEGESGTTAQKKRANQEQRNTKRGRTRNNGTEKEGEPGTSEQKKRADKKQRL